MSTVLPDEEARMRQLHHDLLQSWNDNDATAFASLFLTDAICVGFDGTEYTTASQIRAALTEIFEHHQVASYVSKVRDVRRLDQRTLVLRAVAGMVASGGDAIKPEQNAVQVLIACEHDGSWRIASYQNTPARYDGRPEESRALTEELQAALTDR